jgi:predicted NBD/HSP70 family sugar kinase
MMMAILSIDPGRRHFAACVVSLSGRVLGLHLRDVSRDDRPSFVRWLDGVCSGTVVSGIVVERQVGNSANAKYQVMVETYAACRGLWCHATREKRGVDAGAPYAERKRRAIQLAELALVDVEPDVKGVWSGAGKRDDLADAILQGLAHLDSHGEHGGVGWG